MPSCSFYVYRTRRLVVTTDLLLNRAFYYWIACAPFCRKLPYGYLCFVRDVCGQYK